jgi:hypothetical protein
MESAEDMKSFVLMNKRTGELGEGYRIMFFDQQWSQDTQPPSDVYHVFLGTDVEWILVKPDVCPVPLFISSEDLEHGFEILGEL